MANTPGGINLPSMVPASGGSDVPWSDISGAIASFPQIRQKIQQDREDRQYLLEQRKAQQQQLATQTAGSRLEMLKPMLLADPKKASDPAYAGVLKGIYQQLGLPAPINPDGTINLDEFKTPFSTLDEKTVTQIMSMPQAQRKVALDRYSGVPQNAYTTDQFISSKDQAALQNARTKETHDEEWEKIQNSNIQIRNERTQAMDAGDYAKVNEIDAKISNLTANTARTVAETNAIGIRLDQAQQRINDAVQRTRMIGQRGGQGGFQAMRMMNSVLKDNEQIFNQADNAYRSALTSYNQALSGGADAGSPQMQQAKQQLDALQQKRDAASNAYNQATSMLQGEQAALATANHLSGITGNPTEAVPTTSRSFIDAAGIDDDAKPLGEAKGQLEGTRGEYKGRNIIVHDGNWYYLP